MDTPLPIGPAIDDCGLQLTGTAANETLVGSSCRDVLRGQRGRDRLLGRGDNDLLFGKQGNDRLFGGGGRDRLFGGRGNDLLKGGAGNDFLNGHRGNDRVFGGGGRDRLIGRSGNDRLFGNGSDDLLLGGNGNDRLVGGRGSDRLHGDAGNDILIGGAGADIFRLGLGDGTDTIQDFELGGDCIELEDGLTFADLSFQNQDGSTLITVASTGESLAIVVGLSAEQVSSSEADCFSTVTTPSPTSSLTPNQAPVAVADAIALNEGGTATSLTTGATSLLANDSDPDGDRLTLNTTPVSLPRYGTLALNVDGGFSYVHDGSENFTDSFTYQISDPAGLTSTAIVTINITPLNDPPSIISNGGGAVASIAVAENQTVVTDVQASDPEGSVLTYSISGGTDASAFGLNATTGVLTFNTAPNFEMPTDVDGNNIYNVEVTVTDPARATDTQAIAITVTDVFENIDPAAQNQSYSTVGNTALEVAGADVPGNEVAAVTSGTNLLTGATDANGDTLTVQAETLTTTEGGRVTINSDGSFYYIPEAGDNNITDTFTFTVLDTNGGSDTATASITVGDRIWYVDDDAAPGGDGTSANPFSSLAPLDTGGSSDGLDGPGDTIYVLEGTYSSGLTLEDNQSLLGQGVDLVVDGRTLITATNRPVLSATGGDVITLANNNTLEGFSINGLMMGQDGIAGVGGTGGTINGVLIEQMGRDNIHLDNWNGITFNNITSTDATRHSVSLNNTSSTIDFTGNNTINHGSATATGDAFHVDGGDATINYSGNITTSTNNAVNRLTVIRNTTGGSVAFSGGTLSQTDGDGIFIEDSAGTTTIDSTINITGGAGMEIQRGTGNVTVNSGTTISNNTGSAITVSERAGGTVQFGAVNLNNSGGIGFNLNNNSASSNVTVTGTTTIDNATGSSINVTGAGDATFAGVTITNRNASGIDINNTAGTLQFGTTSISGAGGTTAGIDADGTTGGSVTFNNTVNVTGSGAQGINLTNNAGSFTANGLTTIDGATGIGVDINGGTGGVSLAGVTVQNRNNTGIDINVGNQAITLGAVTINNQNSATSTALNIQDTTGGSVTATSTTIDNNNAVAEGVTLVNNAAAINLATGSITGAANTAFRVTQGLANVDYAGSITNIAGRSVQVTGSGGTTANAMINLTGAINDTGQGIFLNNNALNAGATVNFSGGLTLNTGANAAFTATNGGTVNVTGTNTINTTTGTGVNIANTAIGSSNVTFQSVSVNGAANGIIVDNAGSTGSLIVTGVTTKPDGGTIRTTGQGVRIVNANASLSNMDISSSGSNGVEILRSIAGTSAVTLSNNAIGSTSGGATNDGLNVQTTLAGAVLDLTVNNTMFSATNGDGADINGSGGGTLNINSFDSNMVTSAGGDGIRVNTATFNTVNAGTTQVGTTGAIGGTGIDVTNVSGDVTFGGGSSIQNTTGTAFNIDNGTAAIAYGGSITNTSGRSVNVQNRTNGGNITFSGAIADTGGAQGIGILNNAGTNTVNFTGAVDLGTTANRLTGGTALTFTGNSAGTNASFSNLDIATNGQIGINGTTAGTLNITTGTLNTVGAGAVGAQLNNIGSVISLSNVTVDSIGAANNALDFTDIVGTFGVTGNTNIGATGAVGTGINISGGAANYAFAGTAIANSAAAGINVNGTTGGSVGFNSTVNVNGSGGQGINLTDNVAGFTVTGTTTIDSATGSSINVTGAGDATFFTGVTITNRNAGGIDINNTAGTLQFGTTSISGAGGTTAGIDADSSMGGSVTFNNTVNVTGSGAQGINLTNNAGSFAANGLTTIDGATGIGVDINGGTGGISLAGVTVQNRNNTGIDINVGNQAITLGAVTINNQNSTTSTALNIQDTTGGSVTATSTTIDNNNAGAEGVTLVNNAAAINLGSGSITGAANTAFRVTQGLANVDYAGSITNIAGRSVQVENRTGGTVALSGTINDTGRGLLVQNNNGGANINLSGAITANTGTNRAVAINNNTGATVNLSNALNLDTTSATTLDITRGGTVNLSGTFAKVITSTTGTAINIDNTAVNISGGNLNVDSDSGNAFVSGNNATLTIQGSNNNIDTNTGTALQLNTATIGSAGITLATADKNAAGGMTEGIDIDTVTGGTLTVGRSTIVGTAGAFSGIDINDSAATFTFNTATIDGTGGAGINLNGANGPATFTTVDIDGTTGAGIAITGNTNTVNINGGSIGATTTTTGNAVDIDNAQANIVVAAAITNSAGRSVEVTGSGGTTANAMINLTGAINDTGQGIFLNNNALNFGATVNFSGGLTLDTGANAAFTVTNGGTVNVTGTNTINTTTGTGVNIANTTIGSNNVTFQSVSVNGAANGIIVDNAGSAGSLIVTGVTTKPDGGSISTTGAGVQITNSNASLSNMTISSSGNNGVEILSSLAGTSTITLTDNNISTTAGAASDGLNVQTTAGTLNLAVNSNMFSSTGALSMGDGADINGSGGGTLNISSFDGNMVTSAGGNGISVNTATFDASTSVGGIQQVNAGNTQIGTGAIGGNALNLVNVAGDVVFNTGSAIANNTGAAVNIDGGAADITYNGTITNGTGRMVRVANTTGGTVTRSK
ncbi:MAG: hypothetical protein F6K09_01400, partial [Merismopedia sp. SIO2A8]|nr:hypothetical protein [Merismopedia sp. SIO2A8]